ncbi:hypothetical protein SELMODRAFT_442972 [Selaginella moellendorffii]|uniref:FAS1 domain-containing protein n=1 Tax=Selaginella moellendorffii TaxID=88036 RepID=D8RXJ8_SELML|nr:uncharacterized protein LOC9645495 [Selaginella moellendorffii]EFJ23450.1 hypothetical protein SELMODRAFT_442972 [Selaginella moellendorffii]|eukprot:XP_024536288.1 uncharacterized protein LOC9645495 [Selaginella moellendorffii]
MESYRHRQLRALTLVCLLVLCVLLYARSGGQGIDSGSEQLGPIGKSMVDMLGGQDLDLAFTSFVPSEAILDKLVKPSGEDSNRDGNRQALLSRLLASSSVPSRISSTSLRPGEQLQVETISGYKLSLGVDVNRGLVVNGMRCVARDLRIGEMLVVYIVKGVIMDPELRRSVLDLDPDST